ncbi:uncharacterized protein UV8b_03101 [Ustilaginoidea virens]|uniref:Rhodopsin domain-containing protein n=1 Tax=Ustilaginoidea virens TaxID=1159556 RepID=A0A8E5HNR4_USTVR|nr:uncharacterized protein UV8b_03101 [Ustilaginoidea virens]QUC18860.1 hypothetical protein UV8b_03101 [Ustilaginoidea virens]
MAGKAVDLNEYNGGPLVGTSIALLTTSWVAIGLRLYTRLVFVKSYNVDDWLILVAQLLFTSACVSALESVRYGVGKHNDAIPSLDDRVAALMWQSITIAFYLLCMMFVKLSIGLFLLRLATQKSYIWTLRIALVIVTLWTTVIFIWNMFQCTPVQKQWDFRIRDGYCAGPDEVISAAYALTVMVVLSDWFFALIPIPLLWGVDMTKQAKVTVIVILGLGVFASIATLIRLKFLAGLQSSEDLMFSVTDATVWTLVEPGFAIIATSLATIRPLLRSLRIRGFLSTDRASTGRLSEPGTRNGYGSMPGYRSLHSVTGVTGVGIAMDEHPSPTNEDAGKKQT